MVSVVAGVWEFATSGLEMSMVFLWLGVSFLLLVRVEDRRRRAVPAAVVMGLGTLIRPELALGSVVFVVALLVGGGRPRLVGTGRAASAATACRWPPAWPCRSPSRCSAWATTPCWSPTPVWPRPGASAWWSQGFTYLWNFVAPYTLWLPLALAVPFVVAPGPRLVAARRPARGGGAWHADRGRAGRRPLRGARRGRLHARPPAPARVLRPLPSRLRLRPPGPEPAGHPVGRDRGVGGGLRRLAPVRPSQGDQPQPPDRVHLQRAQQLDHCHRQRPPGHRRRLRQGPVRSGRHAVHRLAHQVPAGPPATAGHHQPLRPDRPVGNVAGPIGAAVHPGRQRARHRRHRLPGRSRRLHLRLVLAGQSHRQPHRGGQARPSRPREVHRTGLDGGPLRHPGHGHDPIAGGPSPAGGGRRPAGAGLRPAGRRISAPSPRR